MRALRWKGHFCNRFTFFERCFDINHEILWLTWKGIVYEYDDYDFPMNQIFPTKSMVEKARKIMYD